MQNTWEVQARLNPSMEKGVGHEVPPLANEQQRAAERKSPFPLKVWPMIG